MRKASSFTFGTYSIDKSRSIITFVYRVKFQSGKSKTYYDKLILDNVAEDAWDKIPRAILESTLQSLLLMFGINYWCVFPTPNIHIESFVLSYEQAQFWETLYLKGLGEFFYDMKIDFRGLIKFPHVPNINTPTLPHFERPSRMLVPNGGGKDSIVSAEILKDTNKPFDFFAYGSSPAQRRIAKIAGVKMLTANHRRDINIILTRLIYNISGAYPSICTIAFVSILIAELFGYDSIVFSNERSADFGNLIYLNLDVNHQWSKSSESEKMINEYIHKYITSSISVTSIVRKYSELELVRLFSNYPKYFQYVTSCNEYSSLLPIEQSFIKRGYWCNKCAKCVFLFACFSAFIPKKEVLKIFKADLYRKKSLLPLFKEILGIEGFKPFDCVGEPKEMISAMHLASQSKQYKNEIIMNFFEEKFDEKYDFENIKQEVLRD